MFNVGESCNNTSYAKQTVNGVNAILQWTHCKHTFLPHEVTTLPALYFQKNDGALINKFHQDLCNIEI